jgi:hypothetical protein
VYFRYIKPILSIKLNSARVPVNPISSCDDDPSPVICISKRCWCTCSSVQLLASSLLSRIYSVLIYTSYWIIQRSTHIRWNTVYAQQTAICLLWAISTPPQRQDLPSSELLYVYVLFLLIVKEQLGEIFGLDFFCASAPSGALAWSEDDFQIKFLR